MRSLLLEKYRDLVRRHVRGIIQIGASTGQECNEIEACGIKHRIYIEPLPYLCEQLQKRIGNDGQIFQLACADWNGLGKFFINVGDESSSVYDLNPDRPPEHLSNYHVSSTTVEFIKLDDLVRREKIDMCNYNLLMMDTLGSELSILRGATETLKHIDIIQTEGFLVEIYKDAPMYDKTEALLLESGFDFMDRIPPADHNPVEIDAIFIKKGLKW